LKDIEKSVGCIVITRHEDENNYESDPNVGLHKILTRDDSIKLDNVSGDISS